MLGTCIVKGRFDAALGYNYTTYHHELIVIATAPRRVGKLVEQQLVDDAYSLATIKVITDVEQSRRKSPPVVTDFCILIKYSTYHYWLTIVVH